MKPEQLLDAVLPRWRAEAAKRWGAPRVDRFVESARPSLVEVARRVLRLVDLGRGAAPGREDRPLLRRLFDRASRREAQSDFEIFGEAAKRAQRRGGERAIDAFVEARRLALALEREGWEARAILADKPAVAVRWGDDSWWWRSGDEETRIGEFPVGFEDSVRQIVVGLKRLPGRGENHALAVWRAARGSEDDDRPPDARTPAWRTKANLAAIKLLAAKENGGGALTRAEREVVAGYSGWGGLSIDAVRDDVPEGWTPETFGLIHEYYTPTAIADSIARVLCPFLPSLVGSDGVLRALEPSAGIGRLVRAFSPRTCLELEVGGAVARIDWTAVEFSAISARLLSALRPDVALFQGPFERWVRTEGAAARGTINLVVANPPYGDRGAFAREDPAKEYAEKRAYVYFMRRALDLLVPGGVGVFLIPAGFLTGRSNEATRRLILRRHHLLGAYRLPSHDLSGRLVVPGAYIVMDCLFWQSRGGELPRVDAADEPIAEGRYFERYPSHLLGVPRGGAEAAGDLAGRPGGWRYRIDGDFNGLPPLEPRPICSACTLTSIAPPQDIGTFQTVVRAEEESTSEETRGTADLARRVLAYRALVAAEDVKANGVYPELRADLVAFIGLPDAGDRLRALAREAPDLGATLRASFDGGSLAASLREAPDIRPPWSGEPDDVVGQADSLFRQRRALQVEAIVSYHRDVGGTMDEREILRQLFAAGWCLDGISATATWTALAPGDVWLTGTDLWEKYDRMVARGDELALAQAKRLLDAIQPAVYADISDISPQHGYVPLELVAEWLSDTLNSRYGPIELERVNGLVRVAGRDYGTSDEDVAGLTPDTIAFLGYYNHDPALFKPPKEKKKKKARWERASRDERDEEKKNLAERRRQAAAAWAESFGAWLGEDSRRRDELVEAYNRTNRGRIVPTYTTEPLEIARWGPGSPKLRPHQVAGAKRVLDRRGGLVAFDVGVGKTYTALAVLARARQEGWVRRPVVLVPSSLVWKWHDDILCTLPDYRVVVIGSNRKRITRGERKGIVTSETDTPEQRAAKWSLLQTGQADVVVLSYDALGRTRMNAEVVEEYIRSVEAVDRAIEMRRRNLEEKAADPKRGKQLSERERALLEHGVRAWIEEVLALPADWKYDPGVAWDEIGVDLLIVDEAAAFKNLYMPEAREDGVPKFMGGGGEGSDRAWQFDFRAAAVRKRTGGAGIVLLTATPAKNSPLEFYNLIQFIDPNAWLSAGVQDPEQFIDRFIRIEPTQVLDSALQPATKSAVTGFKNLDDLRTIILTYGEFRTGAEVGLKLPEPQVETLTIPMDDAQETKYDTYVKQIEAMLDDPAAAGGGQILGLMARLSLIALHPDLEEGYDWKTALNGGIKRRKVRTEDGEQQTVSVRLPRPASYAAPKLTECARRVAASQHCGHIIFCEPTAVHQWMREVLVDAGVPRERIAILNAETAAPADRVRIAREFNGLNSEPPEPGSCARPQDSRVPPKYDVVIANSVAYEGVDLQVRTCSIHHLDLPWTPADLEQRNGRAVRQGNTLAVVAIYYYFADRSTDGYRFSLIDGKAGWLGQVIRSQVRDTNNPAAQQQLTPEDILLMISRDKEKTRELLERSRARAVQEAREKAAKEAARLLRQAAARFEQARGLTGDSAQRLREEAEERLEDLERVDVEAWPWAPWAHACRDHRMIVPEGRCPAWEGLRVAMRRPGAADETALTEDDFVFVEFGQVLATPEGEKIAVRQAGESTWSLIRWTGEYNGRELVPADLPSEGGAAWPASDLEETRESIVSALYRLRYGRFESLQFQGGSDDFFARFWGEAEPEIRKALAKSYQRETVPVERGGALVLALGDEVMEGIILPPSAAGWRRYLELAPTSGLKFNDLRDLGAVWWKRKIPQNLLSEGREERRPERRVEAVSKVEGDPKEVLEAARAELRGLRLPQEQYLSFLRQVQRAVERGRSPEAILGRARAEAPEPEEAGPRKKTITERVAEAFDAEPAGDGYRLEVARVLSRGSAEHVRYQVVDVDGGWIGEIEVDGADNIVDENWSADMTEHARRAIVARLERSLALADLDADEARGPDLEHVVAALEERARRLGLAEGADDREVAGILRVLATPRLATYEDLEAFFTAEAYVRSLAALQQTEGQGLPAEVVVAQIWTAVDQDLGAVRPTSIAGGAFSVPRNALMGGDRYVVGFFDTTEGRRFERVAVEVDSVVGTTAIVRSSRLTADTPILVDDVGEAKLAEVFRLVDEYGEGLRTAPRQLRDVRTLLYWAWALTASPACLGRDRADAQEALRQARSLYDAAVRELAAGMTREALRRGGWALRRIAAAAARVAESCSEGQTSLPGFGLEAA